MIADREQLTYRMGGALLALVFSLVLLGEPVASLECPHHGGGAESSHHHGDHGSATPVHDDSTQGPEGSTCDCPGMCPVSGGAALALTPQAATHPGSPPPVRKSDVPARDIRPDPQQIPFMHPYAMGPPGPFL